MPCKCGETMHLTGAAGGFEWWKCSYCQRRAVVDITAEPDDEDAIEWFNQRIETRYERE